MQGGKTAFREGRNKVQKSAVRVLLWVLTLGMCVLIFGFSAQDGETSMETSGLIAEPIARKISNATGRTAPSEYQEVLMNVQAVVRKTAHFSEYALLGLLVFLLHVSYERKYCVIPSWIFTTVYAAGDEVHQWIGGPRTGMWQGVGLDACGAITGILLCRAAVKKLANRPSVERKLQ